MTVLVLELCPFQAELFKRLVESKVVEQVLDRNATKAMILSLLNIFLKMANHPALLMNTNTSYGTKLLEKAIGEEFLCDNFEQFSEENLENCGKLKVERNQFFTTLTLRLNLVELRVCP